MTRTTRICAMFVASALVSTMSLALVPVSAHALVTSVVTCLKTSKHIKELVDADGHLIVYQDEPDGIDGGMNVAVYDLADDSETTIATDARFPHVEGETIVYWKNDAIYAYDWLTRTERRVASAYFGVPAIDGDVVVCNQQTGLSGTNLSDGTTFTVSSDPTAYAPDMSNGWVVYCVLKTIHGEEAQGDIMAYCIATGKTYTLCRELHDQRNPSVSSTGLVVWADERNNASTQWSHTQTDIYGCYVDDRRNFLVMGGSGAQSQASSDGSIVSYMDSRSLGGPSMLGLDTLSGVRFAMVPPSLFSQDMLSISPLSDGIVAWSRTTKGDDGNGGSYTTAIYIARPTQMEVTETFGPCKDAALSSSEAFPEGAAGVVIASAESWADDLAAASLVDIDSPLLLTERDVLPQVTIDEIRRLGATSAMVIGSDAAISAGVRARIREVIEQNIASGPSAVRLFAALPPVESIRGDRYQIADAIALRAAARPGWDGTVIVASGARFADSLTAAPLASSAGIPVVLATVKGLSAGEREMLRNMGTKRVLVMGDTTRVTSKVEPQLADIVGTANVVRFAGANSYSTAAKFGAYCVKNYGMTWNGVGVASLSSFAHALVGGLGRGRAGSVLLLTDRDGLSSATKSTLTTHRVEIRKASFVGNWRIVTRAVRGQVRSVLH